MWFDVAAALAEIEIGVVTIAYARAYRLSPTGGEATSSQREKQSFSRISSSNSSRWGSDI